MMRFLYFFILICSLNTFSLGALMPDSFEMSLEQVHKSLVRKKEKKTQVKLQYLYPGHIILASGKETIYISNGKKSWYYTAPFIPDEPGEMVVRNKIDLGLLKFFDSLKKGIEKNPFFKWRQKGNKLVFSFNETGVKQLALKEAIFTSKKIKKIKNLTLKDFSEILLKKTNHKNVLLKIKSFNEKKFNSRHFKFIPPANTKLIYR